MSPTNGKGPAELVPPLDPLVVDTAKFVRRFMVVSARQLLVCALWIIHTHAIEAAEQTPYLNVSSPEPRCGKSRLLEVIGLLVREPVFTSNTSAAALFRTIAKTEPTMLIDESDATFGEKKRPSERAEDLRGILNAGHRRGAYVMRCIGQNHAVAKFQVYCPKAFAGIGTLPDTIADRSIPIRLEAKTKDELVRRFLRRDEEPRAAQLRERIAEWVADNVDRLRDDRPNMPDQLDDRMVEGCEPLIAIADRLGCGKQARAAVVALCTGNRVDSQASEGRRLLADIRSVVKHDERAVWTEDLLGRLNAIQEAPWHKYDGGWPMEPVDLANLLKRYGVHSRDIKLDGVNKKGYRRRDLAPSWERYA